MNRITSVTDDRLWREVEARAELLASCSTAGKVTVELSLKDGHWRLTNVSVTFPGHRDG